MTEEQRLFVNEKSHLRPTVTVHEPSGYIQVRAVGRDGGINWKRTWNVSPHGAVSAPDRDWDGNVGQRAG